jgi:hypothetical protein
MDADDITSKSHCRYLYVWRLIVLVFLIRIFQFTTPFPKRRNLASLNNFAMAIFGFERHKIIEALIKFSLMRPLETRIFQALNL